MIQPGIKPGVWTSMQQGKAFPGFLDINKQIRDVLNSNGYPVWGDCCITAPLTTDIGKVLTIGANGIVLATASGSGVVNLALGIPTATTFPITNGSGTGFILPSANSTQAGLLSSTLFNSITGIVTSGLLSTMSISGNGLLGTAFQLVNDSATPGNNYYYGTNALGVKGYYAVTSGITNLGYTASPTNGVVTNSNGTTSTIPLADITNAGLQSPSQFTKLENLSGTNTGDVTVTDSNSIDFTLTGQNITGDVIGLTTATTGQVPSKNASGSLTWVTPNTGITISDVSTSFKYISLTPTGFNTIPSLLNLPLDNTEVVVMVNGNVESTGGIVVSAAGVVTVNTATLGYNIDTSDVITLIYFSS